jgi:hypothetical protein
VKGSERAYTTYLNSIRASTFDALTKGGNMSEADLKAVANFINLASGRGNLGGFDKAADAFAQILFSPRYLTSRFQVPFAPLMGGGQVSGKTRVLIAGELAKYAAAVGGMMVLAKGAGAEVNYTDPQSPDFLKIKIGDTRIDVLAGFQQNLRLIGRLATVKPEDRPGIVGRFALSKTSPSAGMAWAAFSGKDFLGNKFDVANTAKDAVTPMIVNDTYEAMLKQGIPKGLAFGLLSGLGVGVSTYKPGQKDEAFLDYAGRKLTGN